MHSSFSRKSDFLTVESTKSTGDAMNKLRSAVVAAVVIGATALTTLRPASAWWGHPGPFFWGGVAVGAVTGAIVGSAVAAAPYYSPPYPYYGPYPYRRCPAVWNGYAWVRSCY
jgi:hypothetical protein